MSRREELADAAIRVVAQHGLKGLTHRAVDAAAGAPEGSTSNHFRTRQALVDGVAERLEAADLELAAELGPARWATGADLDAALGLLAAYVAAMATSHRTLVLVRMAMFLDAPDRFSPGHARFLSGIETMLRAAGVAEPQVRARSVIDYLDGLLLHVATVRASPGVQEHEVVAVLRRLVSPCALPDRSYCASPATRLMVTAMTPVPNR